MDYESELAAIRTLVETHNALQENKDVSAYETSDLRDAVKELAKVVKVKATQQLGHINQISGG